MKWDYSCSILKFNITKNYELCRKVIQEKNYPDKNSYRFFKVIACNIHLGEFLSATHYTLSTWRHRFRGSAREQMFSGLAEATLTNPERSRLVPWSHVRYDMAMRNPVLNDVRRTITLLERSNISSRCRQAANIFAAFSRCSIVRTLTDETSVPGIEPETCSQSFGHHTKALALSFWTYSFRWIPNHQKPEKHVEKIHWCWPEFKTGPSD